MSHSHPHGRRAVFAAVVFASVTLSGLSARADTALLLAKEGVNNLFEISGVSTNGAGGFVAKFNYGAAGNTGTATLYGSSSRTTGAALRTEGTVGGFAQLNFFSPTLNNTGQLAYTSLGASSTSAAYLDGTLLAQTGAAIPAGPFAGKYFGSTIANSSLSNTGVSTYTADTRDAPTGNPTGRAIFVGDGSTVLLKTGDTIANAGQGSAGSGNVIVAPTPAADNANVILDTSSIANTSVSQSGGHYVTVADIGRDLRVLNSGGTAYSTQSPADDLVLVNDGAAATLAGGGIARKGETVPTAAGGLGNGETIRSFQTPKVNSSGKLAYGLDLQAGSNADDYVIVVGNAIVAREHTSLNGVALGDIGISPSLDLNDAGDYAFTFGTQIFVDGQRVIGAGDLVDTDSDGTADTALSGNIATQGFALGSRLADGTVDVYFTGRTAGSTTDYLYRLNVAVPEPTSLAALGLVAGGLLRRRRA